MDKRKAKFKSVAARRQLDVALVLENITDMHNTGAVMRTCDAVGISRLFILNTDEVLQYKNYIVGKRTSSGSRKWVEIEYYTDRAACFQEVRKYCEKIYATHLNSDSIGLYDCDFTSSCALIFGNEKDGISGETLEYADQNFVIPMHGMVQSLNISVACAVTLYELQRQRLKEGNYAHQDLPTVAHQEIYQAYLDRHQKQNYNKKVERKG